MPSNHFILCHPFLFLPSIFPSIELFSSESALCITWPKYQSFSFSISPSSAYSGLISFRINWFDLAVQGTLKSLLQHPSLKASLGGEGDDRGWDGWRASLTWWTWVWASYRSCSWIGKPGMLQSMELQSQTQLTNWTESTWGGSSFSVTSYSFSYCSWGSQGKNTGVVYHSLLQNGAQLNFNTVAQQRKPSR